MRKSLHTGVVMGLLLAATGPSLWAQSPAQFVTWGDRAMEQGEPYGASRYYAEALKQEAGTMEVQWKYAEACRLSHQYGLAAEYYDRVQQKDHARKHPEALRWLAEMQMSDGQHKAAEATWNKTLQREKKKDSFIAQRARNGLEGCRMALSGIAPEEGVELEHLPMDVNTYESEFGARTGPDSALYFTSLRGELGSSGEVLDTSMYHARIYRTDRQGEGWAKPELLPAAINDGGNNANITWSTDGRWLYFSRDDGKGIFSIWAWQPEQPSSTPVPVLGEYGVTYTQPMVAEIDGVQTMFFVKSNTGDRTDRDLWSCTVDGPGTSNARPLGAPVNTLGNETCPFFDSATNMLWFSSDFLPGFGGYDLFKSPWTADGFGEPENAGLPLNSPANDLYPAVYQCGARGWLTSNRVGSLARKGETCCNDLYAFTAPGKETAPSEVEPDTLAHTALDVDTADFSDPSFNWAGALSKALPIRLYFHNDEPNPRSWATTTRLDYEQTFNSYSAKQSAYDSAWQATPEGSAAFRAFFTNEVEANFQKLDAFVPLLLKALESGQQLTLVIRGYASPLAKGDYNKNLSLRRIKSLVNYLERTGNGQLLPYLRNTADNGGRLIIEEQPYGKSTADASVSDRLDDLRHSVYSVGAAKERRIEIEQVIGQSER